MADVLFIGGTHGKKIHSVGSDEKEVIIDARRAGFQTQVGGLPKKEKYVLQELLGADGRVHKVFVLDGTDALGALLDDYRCD